MSDFLHFFLLFFSPVINPILGVRGFPPTQLQHHKSDMRRYSQLVLGKRFAGAAVERKTYIAKSCESREFARSANVVSDFQSPSSAARAPSRRGTVLRRHHRRQLRTTRQLVSTLFIASHARVGLRPTGTLHLARVVLRLRMLACSTRGYRAAPLSAKPCRCSHSFPSPFSFRFACFSCFC